MLYPSSFHVGIPGYPVAIDHLYELLNRSTKRAVERMQGTGTVVRPWIQDFRDYAFDRRKFSPQEIRDQLKGVLDGGGKGWMLWNARARYTQEAVKHVSVNSPVEWSNFRAKVGSRCHTRSQPLRLSLPFPERPVTQVVPVSDVRFGRTTVSEVCPR